MLGRQFRLILHPHKDVLHHNFKAYEIDGDGKETVQHTDHDSFYSGRVFGETVSSVRAHIENGLITASVVLNDETYHIEPSWRHLPHLGDKNMLAYRASDVKLSWHTNSDGSSDGNKTHSACGYVKEGLELETDDDDDDDGGIESKDDTEIFPQSVWKEDIPASTTDLSENHTHENEKLEKRTKRQADQYEYTPTKTRCPLLLVADYRFFQEMGGSNTKTTINYLISLIDRVHKIYNGSFFFFK